MTELFQHALIPIDLSGDAEHACARVASLARLCGARLTLLHVVQDVILPPPAGLGVGGSLHAPDLAGEVQAARERLETVRARHFAGLRCDLEVRVSTSAAECISRFAGECACDLIAMPTHGRSGLERWVLGSVAESVLRHAGVAVLLFPVRLH